MSKQLSPFYEITDMLKRNYILHVIWKSKGSAQFIHEGIKQSNILREMNSYPSAHSNLHFFPFESPMKPIKVEI